MPHLPLAVLAFFFFARRVQPPLSLVDNVVDFLCILAKLSSFVIAFYYQAYSLFVLFFVLRPVATQVTCRDSLSQDAKFAARFFRRGHGDEDRR